VGRRVRYLKGSFAADVAAGPVAVSRRGAPTAWVFVVVLLLGALFLALADTAKALPPNPWTGQWRDGSAGVVVTLTQSGSSITGTAPCAGGVINYTGTASPDNTTANFTYAGVVCTGTGGTFTATMSADGRTANGRGTTQFGTGFGFSWTYVTGGNEPRDTRPPPPGPPPPGQVTPPAPAGVRRALCEGGVWSGLWGADGYVQSITQRGNRVTGELVGEPGTMTGDVVGNTIVGSYRVPDETGTLNFALDRAGNSFLANQTRIDGVPAPSYVATFIGCAPSPVGANLARSIPDPQVFRAGPTTILAPGTISIRSLNRSKCVLCSVATRRPARALVSIFSGRRSIRLFGQKRVVFRRPGRKRVCVPVPFRARTFDVRTRLNIALGYRLGARPRPAQRRPAPVIRRIQLIP
jgi:hypothetical protein